MLAVAYYLALQDRVGEALDWFARVDRKAVPEQMQCDYLEAYLAFYRGGPRGRAQDRQAVCRPGVDRWRNRFAHVMAQLDEPPAAPRLPRTRRAASKAQAALAATEPSLELQVEAGRIRLDYRNLKNCALNYYPMDIELLFSRSPFLQEGSAHSRSSGP